MCAEEILCSRGQVLYPADPDIGRYHHLRHLRRLGQHSQIHQVSKRPCGVCVYSILRSVTDMSQLPLTTPYPGPRSVLVLDNCSIHHSEEIRALVEDEACKLHHPPALEYSDLDCTSQCANSCSSPLILLITIRSNRRFRRSSHSSVVTGRTTR